MKSVHHAGVWARLLEAGANAPDSLGRRLLPLLDTSALLAHPATRYAAGLLICALGPLLDQPGARSPGELIEVFVRAGWPSAITLAYQLPDAFR